MARSLGRSGPVAAPGFWSRLLLYLLRLSVPRRSYVGPVAADLEDPEWAWEALRRHGPYRRRRRAVRR